MRKLKWASARRVPGRAAFHPRLHDEPVSKGKGAMQTKPSVKTLVGVLVIVLVVGAFTAPAAGDYAGLVESYSPTAYWRLGEGSGSIAFDQVGALNGTYHGGVGLNEAGAVAGDSAAHFWVQGPGYVEIPHSDDLLLDSGTIAFWFKDTGSIRMAGLLSKDSSGYDTGGHLTVYTEQQGLSVRLQSTNESYFVQSDPFVLDQWYRAAFTFGPAGMNLYVDGLLADSNSYTGGLGSTSGGVGNFEPLVLGANSWVSGNRTSGPLQDYYSGLLDEVAIFDYALTPEEVRQLHGPAVPDSPTLALVALGSLFLAWRDRRIFAIYDLAPSCRCYSRHR